jgi:formylglycine-generating enzyme required for sulfatase activity
LVWALASGDESLLEATALLLGFEAQSRIELKANIRATSSTPDDVALQVEPASDARLDFDEQPLQEIPFWRLEGYKPVAEALREERQSVVAVDPVSWRNRPADPPALRLLAPWRELRLRLRTALTESREGPEIDIHGVVRRLSCGQLLDRLPREPRRWWGPYLQVIIDRSEHLVPYWTDQDQVCGELARLFAAQDLEQAVFYEGLSEPRLLGTSSSKPYRPLPGGIVLVLGDLGCLTPRAADEDNPWRLLGQRITAANGRPVALLPCPVARCPTTLSHGWQLIPWERPRGEAITDRHRLQARAERLLRLVSPAVRIEPGFLRAVRWYLGADEADAGTESDVWQHPAIISTHSDAATLDPVRAKALRAAFAAEPPERQQPVLALLRTWRSPLPEAIWFEEIRELLPHSREALPNAGDLEDARHFFEAVCNRLEPTTDGPSDAAVGAWMGRVSRRATKDFWTIDDVGTRLLRIDWLRNRHSPDYHPPVPCDPALLPVPSGQRERRYELRQQGSEVILSEVSSPAGADTAGAGSYLGSLCTGNQLVRIDSTISDTSDAGDRNAFWKSGQPPNWADDWGTDDYGQWATFSVENAPGETITQRLRWIESGRFLMGSPADEPERDDNETPHEVTISQGFWLFDTACTQALWEAVMGNNPSRFNGPDRPVENVSWHDCQDFLQRLNERIPGLDLSLPSEAQWEYPCRAGTTTPFSFGANIIPEQVNYNGEYPYADGKKGQYRGKTVPVASLPPNPWGLYEMHGNVWEWCQDQWHDTYQGAPTDGSAWEDREAGAARVLRGGSWLYGARGVRAAYRSRNAPDGRNGRVGFRCARVQAVSSGSGQGAEPAGPAPGREAEPRPAQGLASGAPRAEPTLLRLDVSSAWTRCPLPPSPVFYIHTDREHLTFRRLTQPSWASAIGRDRFGLWCEFTVEPKQGEPVIQRLRWIPPGRFWMGSAKEEPGRYKDEGPQHSVTIRAGFWLFDTPCTQALWTAVMGDNPSRFQSPTRPVENVSWQDTQRFIRKINGQIAGLEWVLPSEAQWEYACRAGTEMAIYNGPLEILGENNAPALDPIAWYGGNSGVDFEVDRGYDSSDWPEKQYPHTQAGTRPVKLKRANPWGLYDMLGNVWEWCQDHWHDHYEGAPTDGSAWLSSDAGASYVLRGGSWDNVVRRVRAACRDASHSEGRLDEVGFRCARVQAVSSGRQASQSGAAGTGAAPAGGAPGHRGSGSRSGGSAGREGRSATTPRKR